MPGTGSLRVVVRSHWVNAAIVVPFARPYVRVDGQEYDCRWNRDLRVDVPAGRHVVETFIRYRGVGVALGTGRVQVDVDPGKEVRIASRNGWLNHMPFRPVVQPSRP